MKKPRIGRPPADPKLLRGERVTIRLTESEYKRLCKLGIPSTVASKVISEWLARQKGE